MKNKFSNDIKMVKFEMTSAKARDDLLNNKLVYVNYICYEIEEYITPVNVLICSKCCSIGHYRRQCTEQEETSDIANNNKSQHIHNNFPRTVAPWAPSSNPMDLKLSTLISGLSQVNETLSKLCVTNQGFQQFMIEKNENDIRINNEIDDLKSVNNKMDQDVIVLNEKVNDLDKLMKSNDGIFKQFLFPMLDDILKFIDT
ncbi:unnamed protein product, partial [Adineta steineri]